MSLSLLSLCLVSLCFASLVAFPVGMSVEESIVNARQTLQTVVSGLQPQAWVR